ncbi:hypothetical protein ACTFIU_002756 [Dictyostelium citrinum]
MEIIIDMKSYRDKEYQRDQIIKYLKINPSSSKEEDEKIIKIIHGFSSAFPNLEIEKEILNELEKNPKKYTHVFKHIYDSIRPSFKGKLLNFKYSKRFNQFF